MSEIGETYISAKTGNYATIESIVATDYNLFLNIQKNGKTQNMRMSIKQFDEHIKNKRLIKTKIFEFQSQLESLNSEEK